MWSSFKMSKEVADEYASSLADLTVSSKPLINMLTILALENIDHAEVIVDTVEKHLEKVQAEIKLPVLYLVDSIIKKVGGAYIQNFSLSIINMFTRTFKQVDEKIRAKMLKLRQTWHYVFPAMKLYQLDLKVKSIDPAWPIQAQPPQSNIHTFPQQSLPTTSTTTVTPAASDPHKEDEEMKKILAKKKQELRMLHRMKVEMLLVQMQRKLEMAEKTDVKIVPSLPATTHSNSTTVASVASVAMSVQPVAPEVISLPVGARLGPPVNKPASCIAPVSATLEAARCDPRISRRDPRISRRDPRISRRDPRIARREPPARPAPPALVAVVNPNVFDGKPLERVTKRRHVITIDIGADGEPARPNCKMPPIPKISRPSGKRDGDGVPAKRKREAVQAERRRCRGDDAQNEPPAVPDAPAADTKEVPYMLHNRQSSDSPEPAAPAPVTSLERERRRRMSTGEDEQGFDENNKSISIIMSQVKKHFTDGQLDKSEYNSLMHPILQLNEKFKLKEANQRESLEISKRTLNAHTLEENLKDARSKSSPTERNRFVDIDKRVTSSVFLDTPSNSQGMLSTSADSLMRVNFGGVDGPHKKGLLPLPPVMPMFGPYQPVWRGSRGPIGTQYGQRRFRGPVPPYFREKFDKRGPRVPFEHRVPMLPLPTPKIGICQGQCPLSPYERSESPPPLGAPGLAIPPTDFRVIEYIDQDPVKTIQIGGVPKEIRFYDNTAVIMLDWDDPREIKFLPGCRRVTFNCKDSIVLSFNENYKQVEIDDQVFDIKFGAPTRELYINGRWYECYFGGQPLGVIIDGKPRLVHLEGPIPQVDIGKVKRTDLVAGKINLIVNATEMHPIYLDAKVQKILVRNGQFLTVRFVDSLRTVLINEQPFKVKFDDLPKPIAVGNEKYFIRFSALPRHIKPGHIQIANMEGVGLPLVSHVRKFENVKEEDVNTNYLELDQQSPPHRQVKTPTPENNTQSLVLDMLASVMRSSIVPASGSDYSTAEPLFTRPENIPGLETPTDKKPPVPALPLLPPNINVNDLFAKLVATGIVRVKDGKDENGPTQEKIKPEEKIKPRKANNAIHRVDLMRSETLRVKQPGLVAQLYGGQQCSSCGVRFPPEQTARYSQHLDWHFRQNRRQRDSKRREHSNHWHYDMADWLQYEELEDLEEKEKSCFETSGLPAPVPLATPSTAACASVHHACALCGDAFEDFYNEDMEEWHLRNSVRHNDDYYHPACFNDYKASLAKAEEEPSQKSTDNITAIEKVEEEAIEIKNVENEPSDQSDNESVVEVVEELQDLDLIEIDEGEEDDVVFKAEPVEEVVVDDEANTDDETTTERKERDRLAHIDFSKVKVKQELIEPDDETVVTHEEDVIRTTCIENTHTTLESSIDGNLQLVAINANTTPIRVGDIRINIPRTLPNVVENQDNKVVEDVSADNEPLPPGEEPELEYTLKPKLEGVTFSRQPPVIRGTELSGLCSIM